MQEKRELFQELLEGKEGICQVDHPSGEGIGQVGHSSDADGGIPN